MVLQIISPEFLTHTTYPISFGFLSKATYLLYLLGPVIPIHSVLGLENLYFRGRRRF